MKTVIWYHGKAQSMRSYNDDLVMACAIGCWVRDTIFTENQRDAEYKKSMIDAIKTSKTIFNTAVSGMSGYDRNKSSFSANIEEEKKKMQEFMWLYKG